MPSSRQWAIIDAVMAAFNIGAAIYWSMSGDALWTAIHATLALVLMYVGYRQQQIASRKREQELTQDVL